MENLESFEHRIKTATGLTLAEIPDYDDVDCPEYMSEDEWTAAPLVAEFVGSSKFATVISITVADGKKQIVIMHRHKKCPPANTGATGIRD